MTLVDLDEYLRVNSLQFFVGDDIEVTDEVLKGLVKKAINVYGNYRPMYIKTYQHLAPYTNSLKEFDGRKIINITDLYYVDPIFDGGRSSVPFFWEWNRESRLIRIGMGGTFHIEALVMPNLEDLDFDQTEFLDMMQGLYMMYIGQSRKSFTLGDLPFENDGAEIYSDGKELYERTVEQLGETNDNWYLAII